ncbi:MAG: hypothetical protein PHU94_00165 [Bacilli bacterium]|nr:hypothetical protein [Bacilli bacterium]MDD4733882.1 hypothetical protein [Bacilli bacterium]
MPTGIIFAIIAGILLFVVFYRNVSTENTYKFIINQVGGFYDRYASYSFKMIRQKVKDLGQEYTPRQYVIQVVLFAGVAGVISYFYFYNLIISIIYAFLAVATIPYLTYLRCKRLYSEYIFEQIQVYTTNTIMEFATTQSFVKALEGVYESGVLEDPVKQDVQVMIDMAYENGTITQSLDYMNAKYDYYIVKNMHQLFLQITNEGSKDSSDALENMSLDIDMLVESVYRDRMDRATFHKKFVQFGFILYLMVFGIQILVGVEKYIEMLTDWKIQVFLHFIIAVNTYFLLNGEKYYNEDVGAE